MAELALEAAGVSKAYGNGTGPVEVLHDVSLAVAPGEFVCVLGPSGSGKSTLLHLLGLMDAPTKGSVRLFGQDAAELGEDARARLRARRLGFVFQFDSLLPEFTVLENALMPARILGGPLAEAESRARELLAELGLGGLEGRMPQQLSGGERQRAAIARALVNEPAVLLADEPTGNLDRANGESVFAKMRELSQRRGVAVVLVTHDEEAARLASRTLRLRDGRVQEEP